MDLKSHSQSVTHTFPHGVIAPNGDGRTGRREEEAEEEAEADSSSYVLILPRRCSMSSSRTRRDCRSSLFSPKGFDAVKDSGARVFRRMS